MFSSWSILSFFAERYAIIEPFWVNDESLGLLRLLDYYLPRLNLQQVLEQLNQGMIRLPRTEFNSMFAGFPYQRRFVRCVLVDKIDLAKLD